MKKILFVLLVLQTWIPLFGQSDADSDLKVHSFYASHWQAGDTLGCIRGVIPAGCVWIDEPSKVVLVSRSGDPDNSEVLKFEKIGTGGNPSPEVLRLFNLFNMGGTVYLTKAEGSGQETLFQFVYDNEGEIKNVWVFADIKTPTLKIPVIVRYIDLNL